MAQYREFIDLADEFQEGVFRSDSENADRKQKRDRDGRDLAAELGTSETKSKPLESPSVFKNLAIARALKEMGLEDE